MDGRHDGIQVNLERDVLSMATTLILDEAAGVFDDLFTRIADPAILGARTR